MSAPPLRRHARLGRTRTQPWPARAQSALQDVTWTSREQPRAQPALQGDALRLCPRTTLTATSHHSLQPLTTPTPLRPAPSPSHLVPPLARYYCEAGAAAPLPCPAGKRMDTSLEVMSSESQCITCGSGYCAPAHPNTTPPIALWSSHIATEPSGTLFTSHRQSVRWGPQTRPLAQRVRSILSLSNRSASAASREAIRQAATIAQP